MMLKAIIVEQLEEDGTLRTFTMQPDASGGHITVALPNEYADPRDGPFHFLDPADELRFREGFAGCRARRLGTHNFSQSGDMITVRSLQWSGIPTERNYLSYYTLAFPEFAIPTQLSITDPHQPGREYRREITRDDERNRWAVYLECSSSLGRFDFVLTAQLEVSRTRFPESVYSDSKTRDGYGVRDDWRHFLPNGDASRVQHFFAERIHVSGSRVDQSTHVRAPIVNSAFAAHSPHTTQTVTVNPDLGAVLQEIVCTAESDEHVTKSDYAMIVREIGELKAELAQSKPRRHTIERILGNLGSVASITSFVDRILPFLPALF